MRCGLPGLRRLLLAGLAAELAADLVVVVVRLAAGVLDALVHPAALHLRTVLERGALVGVLLEVVAGVPTCHVPLLQVRLVAAAVEVDLVLGQVEFEDLGDRAGEELAVVRHDDRARAQAGDEAFEALQAVEVQVVGGLVEEEDVVAGEQEGGQARACRLAAGQGRHRLVQVDRQAQRVGDLLGPFVEVRAAEVEPAFQARRVRVVGAGCAVHQGLGGLVHRALRLGDSRAAGQELAHALARAPLRLLREVSYGRCRRGEAQFALLRCEQAGEHPEQGGLARAVGTDKADHIAGGDDEVEPGEQGAVAVSGGEILGDESGSHQTVDPNRSPSPSAPRISPARAAVFSAPSPPPARSRSSGPRRRTRP
jgi:hypothetical protein